MQDAKDNPYHRKIVEDRISERLVSMKNIKFYGKSISSQGAIKILKNGTH